MAGSETDAGDRPRIRALVGFEPSAGTVAAVAVGAPPQRAVLRVAE